jgi:hypothetical protein
MSHGSPPKLALIGALRLVPGQLLIPQPDKGIPDRFVRVMKTKMEEQTSL